MSAAELTSDDESLDIACGPGLLVCAFATRVRHATGIDLTPAMLDKARQLQREKNLVNVTWMEGDVTRLPFPKHSFSVVTSRYAFHHIPDPRIVLREMVRVCKPGGRIVVVDSAPEESKAVEFNKVERLRDPSHVRALTERELWILFTEEGIPPNFVEKFRLAGDLDSLLSRSFPRGGDAGQVRKAFESALKDDILDVHPVKGADNMIRYSFPIVLLKASKLG
jgi:SAM-dependent methyltransferase